MLQTIEVEIDANGRIHPLESLPELPAGRALLTLLDAPIHATSPANSGNLDYQGLFGLLKAERGVSLDEMDATIKSNARRRNSVIAIDTNVLVRVLADDSSAPEQSVLGYGNR